jgi:CheY-specific phosphatase CheX
MPDTLTSPLLDAASETFEQLAYYFAEAGTVSPFVAEEVEGVVAVAFSGPMNGGIVLQLSGGILAGLAANMLGVDDTPSPEEQRDALGEAANVICGNILPRIAGNAAVFALGVPVAFPTWEAAVEALGAVSAHVRLDVEGGRADIALVQQPSP